MRSPLVHYRIYIERGAFLPQSSAETRDPTIGRILARSVPPPHTAASLKERLCVAENVSDLSCAQLFLSCTARSAINDGDRISLLTGTGPGILPHDPMSLVISNNSIGLDRLASFDAAFSDPRHGK